MSSTKNRQIVLVNRPEGDFQESDFELREAEMPKPGAGEALVKSHYLSLDPAMRGWVRDADSYIEPVQLGDVMRGATVATVVESNNPDYAVGDKVMGMHGWQDYAVIGKGPLMASRQLPPVPVPATHFLSVLGATGLTAYFGLLDVGEPKEGDTLLVSTAAGAVGSIVGQIGKIKGCRVVGIAGSDDKCAWIKDELGFDAAINYKKENIYEAIPKACPDKIDVYFDNVGGDQLNAALGHINIGARIVICGAISMYNFEGEPPPGPSNYITLLTKRSRMQGFVILDYLDRFMEGGMQLAQWVMEGKLKHREHVVDGLENAPSAINMLFQGKNTGKLIVKIADE